jgi:hypothetical protein
MPGPVAFLTIKKLCAICFEEREDFSQVAGNEAYSDFILLAWARLLA